jgi:hypothetical protein
MEAAMNRKIVACSLVTMALMAACGDRGEAYNEGPMFGKRYSQPTAGPFDAGTSVPDGWGGQGTVDTPRAVLRDVRSRKGWDPAENEVVPVRGEDPKRDQRDSTPQ